MYQLINHVKSWLKTKNNKLIHFFKAIFNKKKVGNVVDPVEAKKSEINKEILPNHSEMIRSKINIDCIEYDLKQDRIYINSQSVLEKYNTLNIYFENKKYEIDCVWSKIIEIDDQSDQIYISSPKILEKYEQLQTSSRAK